MNEYLVLARKYRPSDFSSVSGQEHVTRTLSNAIRRNKIAHAFLFAGPRGVGKTSTARILSKALNCASGPRPDPCSKCDNCREIAAGTSLAVREIDGASHNSVDNVRELIDSFRSLPPPGYKYKIYIIDEVHMLSSAAFNALLKSLEEPPANTIFILATTDAHKIPETVISRCQRHDFRALDVAVVEKKLKAIIKKEKISAQSAVLRMIARISDGSMRDAESLLERVRSYASKEDELSVEEAAEVLGVVGRPLLFGLSKAILERNCEEALRLSREAFARGLDTSLFLNEFVGHFRELLIAAFAGEKGLEDINVLPDDRKELCNQVLRVDKADVQDLVAIARQGADAATRSAYPGFAFEALVVRLATREPVKDLRQIISQIGREVLRSKSHPSPAGPPPPVQSDKSSGRDIIVPKLARNPEISVHDDSRQYKWDEFLSHALKGAGGILGAQLQRVEPTKFSKGDLVAVVPDEFSHKYFLKESNLVKLKDLLAEYFSVTDWSIKMSVGKVSGLSSGTRAVLNQSSARKKEALDEDVLSHPSIKSLKKAFPGAKIEKVLRTSKGPKNGA